jgi:HAMP domain-containing protein
MREAAIPTRTRPTPLPRQVRIPIRIKITLPFLILALVLALSTFFIVTQVALDTVEERFTNQLIEGGRLASEWMTREENRLLETLRFLAHTEGAAEALQTGNSERLRTLSYGIAVNNREEAVAFLDKEGKILLAMRRQPDSGPEEFKFSQGDENYFLKAGFVQKALNHLDDARGDKYVGLIEDKWGRYLYIAGPVYDENRQVAGVVLVGKSLSTLARQIRQETLTQVTLYNSMGAPLASTFFDPLSMIPEEASLILKGQDSSSLKRELEGRRDLYLNYMDYVEITGPWEVRGGEDLGLMGVSLVKTFLVSTSRMTRTKISLMVSFGLLGVILTGVALANRITRPLAGLMEASTEVAKGNLGVQVPIASNDEIAVLANSFNQMVASLHNSRLDLLNSYDHTLEGWSRALEMRNNETLDHTKRAAQITERLARTMGLPEDSLIHVRRGVLLHDIGKMAIPDSILLKPGPLTDEEWQLMRRHPEFAYEMLFPIEFLRAALDIPYCHHEHWDGSGYPRGLRGDEIPLSARIFAVIDVWDALTSRRPYHPPFTRERALGIIRADSGSHFDPQVVDAFLKIIDQY